jgi:hypothetical protein
VTSQPDVACDVCERRLLRGEQPDLFLDAGQPRMVCELCAPRAAHQGWKRGSAEDQPGLPAMSPRRGRGLFERLRASRSPLRGVRGPLSRDDGSDAPLDVEVAGGSPYELLTIEEIASAEAASPEAGEGVLDQGHIGALATTVGPLQRALDAFNAGEYPRRVSSLARSLGEPEVSVRPNEAVASSIVIVIAWELCWYSYEVDLDDMQGIHAGALSQGTELSELGPEDRLANARADSRGLLALL